MILVNKVLLKARDFISLCFLVVAKDKISCNNPVKFFAGRFFIAKSPAQQNAAQQSVHWTLGILRHFRAFSSLRVFPAPRQSPRPPQRSAVYALKIMSGTYFDNPRESRTWADHERLSIDRANGITHGNRVSTPGRKYHKQAPLVGHRLWVRLCRIKRSSLIPSVYDDKPHPCFSRPGTIIPIAQPNHLVGFLKTHLFRK